MFLWRIMPFQVIIEQYKKRQIIYNLGSGNPASLKMKNRTSHEA
jgi:hypothetical protein